MEGNIASGLAWMGFWIGAGIAFFGFAISVNLDEIGKGWKNKGPRG